MYSDNNYAVIAGTLRGSIEFDHEVKVEKFYRAEIEIRRTSGVFDVIPVIISDRLIDVTADYTGKTLRVEGRFSSFNLHEGDKTRTLMYLFAQGIETLDCVGAYENSITIDGFICKQPMYRKTPLGREITDLMIAVNRPYGKTDYLPCITWGRTAMFAGVQSIGTHVKVTGRIQSRNYTKHISETESVEKTAYEVSVLGLEVVNDEI